MKHLFTREEVEASIPLTKNLAETIRKMYELGTPLSGDKTMIVISRDFDIAVELDKAVNMLENVKHWMDKCEELQKELERLEYRA